MGEGRSTEEVWAQLAAPFPPHEIKWRVGSTTQKKDKGMMLAYIDARCVMDRLDSVLGPGLWQSEMTMCHDGRTSCTISVLVHSDLAPPTWIKRTDIAGATDMEGAKGGASDSLKRAAVQLGVGRYLYHLDSPWVEIVARGKSHVMAKGQQHILDAVLAKVGVSAAPVGPQPDVPDPDACDPAADQGGGGTEEPAKGPAKFIDAETKKALYRGNFQALEAVGHSEGAVKSMDNKAKFAPLNYAVAAAGCSRVDELYEEQIGFVKGAIREWIRETKEAMAQGDPPSDDGEDMGF